MQRQQAQYRGPSNIILNSSPTRSTATRIHKMAPIALEPAEQNGHDSFAPVTRAQGKGKVEGVHASARRTPEGGAFKVQAESTKYEEEGIKARFVDRGSAVTRRSFHLSSS